MFFSVKTSGKKGNSLYSDLWLSCNCWSGERSQPLRKVNSEAYKGNAPEVEMQCSDDLRCFTLSKTKKTKSSNVKIVRGEPWPPSCVDCRSNHYLDHGKPKSTNRIYTQKGAKQKEPAKSNMEPTNFMLSKKVFWLDLDAVLNEASWRCTVFPFWGWNT